MTLFKNLPESDQKKYHEMAAKEHEQDLKNHEALVNSPPAMDPESRQKCVTPSIHSTYHLFNIQVHRGVDRLRSTHFGPDLCPHGAGRQHVHDGTGAC